MDAFWISLVAVFLAELGDKTQLVALCLASRFNAWITLAGIFVATLVVHVFSVLLGGGVGKLLPAGWVALCAGVAFIGFGLWTLHGDCLSEDECGNMRGRSPFWIVFITFFLAELGDKTMLSTVALAAERPLIPVWLGSTLGMVISDGLAIIVGQMLGKNLPEKAIKIGAAAIFFGFGIWKTAEGAMQLPQWSWALAAAAALIMIGFYIRANKIAEGKSCMTDFKGGVCAPEFADEQDAVGTSGK